MTPKEQEDADRLARLAVQIARFRDDYPLFSRNHLKIRTKVGGPLLPLQLNVSQKYIHDRLQSQLKDTGMVRAVIVKGRQLGCSTYIGGRFYHKTSFSNGVRTFILTHLDEATNNLFGMVERFHEHNHPLLRPATGKANAKELSFPALDSGYRVGTAGSTAVGRSDTIQLFHGSEAAYWPNAEDHAGGILQTIPLAAGTEIVFESTGNGLLNYFADQYKSAAAGKSNFQAIFVPWFWEPGYRVEPSEGFELSAEESEYAEAYGLDHAQMAWRRVKTGELKEDWRFGQEYPATPEEAFQSSGTGAYIRPVTVARARRVQVTPSSYIPLVIGIDPARGGRDSTAVVDRQGRRAGAAICEEWDETDAMVLAGKIVRLIQRFKPKKVIIDATEGTGGTICDRLKELGLGKIVEPVKFSWRADEEDKYLNKRAEMWAAMKDWFENPIGVQVPDSDDLQAQVCAPIWGPAATRHNSNGQLQIEPKEHVVKRLKRSPDLADALAMTFALPIQSAPPSAPVVVNGPSDNVAGY